MLVSRIAPYAAYSSYTKNQANATTNIAFRGNAPRVLSQEFITAANAVLRKMCGSPIEVTSNTLLTKCEARLGNFAGTEHLCIDYGSNRYVIGLINDEAVGPYSGFAVHNLGSGNFGDCKSLEADQDYRAEVQTAKTLLDELLSNTNEHQNTPFPVFPSLGVKHPKVVTTARR